jgi:sirohydrochlorin ferrochelatase
MKSGRKCLDSLLVAAALLLAVPLLADEDKTGILVIAHGDRHDGWNEGVRQAIAPLRERYGLELAFLYPVPGETLQEGLDRLEARGVDTILVIPLLVSSYSEHFEELEYVLGLRDSVTSSLEPHTPVHVNARIRLGHAIDSSPTVTKILERRARELSSDSQQEVLVLVGHGPNGEDYNRQWLSNMDAMAEAIREKLSFRKTYSLTLRNDAPPDIREAASRALRRVVEEESKDGNVLLLPLLVSYGEVQSGIKERLKGLTYRIADDGLVADRMITVWVEEEIQTLMSKESSSKR